MWRYIDIAIALMRGAIAHMSSIQASIDDDSAIGTTRAFSIVFALIALFVAFLDDAIAATRSELAIVGA